MQNETDNFGIVAAGRATLSVNDYLHGWSCNRKFLLPFRKPP